jgi:excisionase family DNA binding protein
MPLLTPRQAAESLGVSASSLKRWCDQGRIAMIRTPGGHRLLEVSAVVEFARACGHEVVCPEMLGLGPGRGTAAHAATTEAFVQALLQGDEAGCRQLARQLHLGGMSLSALGDELIAPAFRQIGVAWSHGDLHVYQERRACQICLAMLEELGALLVAPPRSAPLAIGGTLACDPYTLPTSLVSLVLRQNVWRTQSLGGGLPLATLAEAVADLRPQLLWLTLSAIDQQEAFIAEYDEFYRRAAPHTAIVVGGRALTPEVRAKMQYTAHCDQLKHLETFAATLRRSAKRGRRK